MPRWCELSIPLDEPHASLWYAVLRWNGSRDGWRLYWAGHVAVRYPVVVSCTGQTLAGKNRYPVSTSYKSDRNYYLTNGHYIIGVYKSYYLAPLNWFPEGAVLSRWSIQSTRTITNTTSYNSLASKCILANYVILSVTLYITGIISFFILYQHCETSK